MRDDAFTVALRTGWPGIELGAQLAGARNVVYRARAGRRPESGGRRPAFRPVPAVGGDRQLDGVVGQEYLDGRPPRDTGDWERVAETLAGVHTLTSGWPQRPGFASARARVDVP